MCDFHSNYIKYRSKAKLNAIGQSFCTQEDNASSRRLWAVVSIDNQFCLVEGYRHGSCSRNSNPIPACVYVMGLRRFLAVSYYHRAVTCKDTVGIFSSRFLEVPDELVKALHCHSLVFSPVNREGSKVL